MLNNFKIKDSIRDKLKMLKEDAAEKEMDIDKKISALYEQMIAEMKEEKARLKFFQTFVDEMLVEILSIDPPEEI